MIAMHLHIASVIAQNRLEVDGGGESKDVLETHGSPVKDYCMCLRYFAGTQTPGPKEK